MIQVGLLGAQGRMGQKVRSILENEFASRATLAAAPARGEPLEPLLACDVIIDFSSVDAMMELARLALRSGGALPAFVVGSTGWKDDQHVHLELLALKTPVLQASNFSTGVLALLTILRQSTPMLERLGYRASIREVHHVHKKDAPSGTAIAIQRILSPKGASPIPTESLREGEVIGDHEVIFQGPSDRIVLGHFAEDRAIFARGAVECALWAATKRGLAQSGLLSIEKFFTERSS